MAAESPPKSELSVTLGHVEPWVQLLKLPPDGQSLYKIMTVENLLRSLTGRYLHLTRVDSYADFPGADANDGKQLPGDQPGNAASRFLKAPQFSAADYYDQSRARTYACCFGLENSDYLWENYANGSPRGKVGLVFDFDKLRARLNHAFASGEIRVACGDVLCKQIFSLSYGIVAYEDWETYRRNDVHLPTPILYSYTKARQFENERELRLSLSALGIGRFLTDGGEVEFPRSLSLPFDFPAAFADGTISELLVPSTTDRTFLEAELRKLGLVDPA